MKKTYKTAHLFGIDFFGSSKQDLLNELGSLTDNSSKTSYIVTPNPEQIIQSRGDKDFLKCLQRADIALPDGVGILLAAKLQRYKDAKIQRDIEIKKKTEVGSQKTEIKRDPSTLVGMTERISGREVVVELLGLAQEKGLKVLVVGGRGLGEIQNAKVQMPNVKWLEGYRDVQNPTRQEEQEIVQTIKKLKPDIVFVAFGAPAQEKWMFTHSDLLEKSKVKIVMAVGGSFDYILGKVPQTPDWVARAGFEWLFRLVTQPWRWRRQLRLIQFIWLVLGQRVRS